MDYDKLEHFITKTMKMTNIYQPVIIRKLIESDNHASVEELAREFINMDDSLLEYYKERVRQWPRTTLMGHEVVDYVSDEFILQVDSITQDQKDRLTDLCEQKIQEFIGRYKDWVDPKHDDAIPITIRYDILAKSGGMCANCGVAYSMNNPLSIDNSSNLQVLCRTCKTEKNSRDEKSLGLRKEQQNYRDAGCLLCNSEPMLSNSLASVIKPERSKSDLHRLVIPNRHVSTFFELLPAERNLCIELIDSIKTDVVQNNPDVNGFDVNFGASLCPVDHAHYNISVIPTRTF